MNQADSPSAKPTLGVAVLGTGFGQKVHIPGFQAHHRTQVVAVQHPDLAKAQAVAAAHQIPHACQRIEDVLALPEVDAVSVATPPFLHYPQAKAALAAGKHILLEKPTALSAHDAHDLHTLAQAQGVIATLDFEFRFVPAWMRLAELLAEGFVGQTRFIKVDWLVAGRADAARPWSWYADADQGGGILGAIGSHTFDYLTWLFGPIQRLCGRLSTAIPKRPDPATGQLKPVTSDDICLLLLEFVDGTPGQVSLSAATYQGRGHWLEIYGDRGTLVLGSDNQTDYVHGFKLWAAAAGSALTEVEIPERLAFPQTYPDGRLAPFIRVVDHWIQSIDQGYPHPPSLVEGITSQRLMDLTHLSHRQGTWVDVPR